MKLSLLSLFTCCATGSRMDSIVLVWNTGMTALVGRPDFKLNPALLEHLAVGQLWKAQFTSFKSTFYTLQQGVGIEP